MADRVELTMEEQFLVVEKTVKGMWRKIDGKLNESGTLIDQIEGRNHAKYEKNMLALSEDLRKCVDDEHFSFKEESDFEQYLKKPDTFPEEVRLLAQTHTQVCIGE